MDTHPELEDRIRRVLPRWDGSYIEPKPAVSEPEVSEPEAAFDGTNYMAFAAVAAASQIDTSGLSLQDSEGVERSVSRGAEAQKEQVKAKDGSSVKDKAEVTDPTADLGDGLSLMPKMESVGEVSKAHIDAAANCLHQIPDALRQAAHEPFAARGIVYALLLDTDELPRLAQVNVLQASANQGVLNHFHQLTSQLDRLHASLHLPLLELAIPALKSLSKNQYEQFKNNMHKLIVLDKELTLKEWAIFRLVVNQCEPPLRRQQRLSLSAVLDDCAVLLSLLAIKGHGQAQDVEQAFGEAWAQLGFPSKSGVSVAERFNPNATVSQLDRSLKRLAQVKPLLKPRVLKAVAICVEFDGQLSLVEANMVRVLASCMDCPMPIQLPDQH